jgi:LGFP repeat
MYGQILKKFRSIGGPDSGIGFPVNDESAVGDSVGRFNNFSEPGGAAIYWTPATGASVIKGRLLDAWRASGAATGPFGYPSADMTEVNGVSVAKFVGPQGTEIRWSDTAGLATVPPAFAASIPGFKAATPTAEGTAAVPTPNVSVNPPVAHGFKWWPLIGLGIAALLAGLLALAGRRWRDRRHRVDVPTAWQPGMPRAQTPGPPRVIDTARGPKVKAPASAVPRVKVPDVPPSPPKAPVAPKAPERTRLTDTNGEPVKAPSRPRPPSMQPSKPPTTTQRFAETPAPPKSAPSQPPVPPPRTVDVVEQGGKTPPLVVNYDSDPAHDIGGIEVTYENNAVGENQQSRQDKSYSAQVGHLGP